MDARFFFRVVAGAMLAGGAHIVNAEQYYVSVSGADSGAGTKASPWKTVQHAIDQAKPGLSSVVNVGPGTYVENLMMTKSLTLQGDKGSPPSLSNLEGATEAQKIVPRITIKGNCDVVINDLEVYYAANGFLSEGAGVSLNRVSLFLVYNHGYDFSGLKKNKKTFSLKDCKLFTYPKGLPSWVAAGDVGIRVTDSEGVINGLEAGHTFDHIISVHDSKVTVTKGNLAGSYLYYADGIRLYGASQVSVADTSMIREGQNGYPLQFPSPGKENAGVGAEINADNTTSLELKNCVIKNFCSGVGVFGKSEGVKLKVENCQIVSFIPVNHIGTGKYNASSPNASILDYGGGALQSMGGNSFRNPASDLKVFVPKNKIVVLRGQDGKFKLAPYSGPLVPWRELKVGVGTVFSNRGPCPVSAKNNTWNAAAKDVEKVIIDQLDNPEYGKVTWQ